MVVKNGKIYKDWMRTEFMKDILNKEELDCKDFKKGFKEFYLDYRFKNSYENVEMGLFERIIELAYISPSTKTKMDALRFIIMNEDDKEILDKGISLFIRSLNILPNIYNITEKIEILGYISKRTYNQDAIEMIERVSIEEIKGIKDIEILLYIAEFGNDDVCFAVLDVLNRDTLIYNNTLGEQLNQKINAFGYIVNVSNNKRVIKRASNILSGFLNDLMEFNCDNLSALEVIAEYGNDEAAQRAVEEISKIKDEKLRNDTLERIIEYGKNKLSIKCAHEYLITTLSRYN